MTCVTETLADHENRIADLETAPPPAIGNFYLTQAEGEAATTSGQYFSHVNGSGGFTYRLRGISGSTIVGTLATQDAVDAVNAKFAGLQQVSIQITNPAADNTSIINAAMTLFGPVDAILPSGTIELGSPVLVQNFCTLRGAGAGSTILKAKPGFTSTSANNAGIFIDGKTCANVKDLTLDMNSVGYNAGNPIASVRVNGIRLQHCTACLVERVHSKNCSGYAIYPMGIANNQTQTQFMSHNITVRDCWTYNSNVHYESMRANDVLFDNCHGRAGDGTINCEAGFHPYVFGERITMRNCSYIGTGAALSIIVSTGAMRQVLVEGCNFKSTNFVGINSDSQGQVLDVILANSKFYGDQGTSIGGGGGGASWQANGCGFYGTSASVTAAGLIVGGECEFRAVNCVAHGTCSNAAGTATGVINQNATKRIYFDGLMKATNTAGGNQLAKGAVNIAISDNTRLEPDVYNRNAPAFLHDQGQAVAINDVTGVSCKFAIQLAAECLNVGEAWLDVTMVQTTPGAPASHWSYTVQFTQGTPFVTVWILGDHVGKTFAWRYRETFPTAT